MKLNICKVLSSLQCRKYFPHMSLTGKQYGQTWKFPQNLKKTLGLVVKNYTILTPLNPTFYIVKVGFTGVYIIFLISVQNIDCGYSLELPQQGSSNEYPQSMF